MMAKQAMAVMMLLAASLVAGKARGQEPAAEPLLKVEGQLTREDAVDPVLKKGFHKVYSVKLTAGAYYQIDLVSKDFDAYLRLEDAKGKQVAEDDDGGGDNNSRIIHKAEASGFFRLIATTYDSDKSGKFILTVIKVNETVAKDHKVLQSAYVFHSAAVLLAQQGKLVEAKERFRKALEIKQALYPKDKYPQGHPELALTLNNLGSVLLDLLEHAEAESVCRQALEMEQAVYPKTNFPKGHWSIALSLSNLGQLQVDQGKYAMAESLVRQALEMRQALYPEGHPDVAYSLQRLGNLYREQGDYTKTVSLIRQSVEMLQKLYPTDKYPRGNLELALALNNLGRAHHALGSYAEAEPIYRQALEMFYMTYPKDKYPQGHYHLALILNSLGNLLHAQGEYLKAEPFYRQALEMSSKLYPKNEYPQGHPGLAASLISFGSCLAARGELAKAKPFLQQSLEMRLTLYPKEKFPLGHPDIAVSLNNLAACLSGLGENAQAEQLFRQCLRMREAIYPKHLYPQGHPDLAFILSNLGSSLRIQGQYAEAEPLNRRGLEMFTQMIVRLGQAAPEAVALNAAASFPLHRDGFLSITKHIPGSDIRTYDAVWQSRSALTRVYQRRHLALAAADGSVRKNWDDLQALRRQREQLIMAPMPSDPKHRDEKLRKLIEQIDATEQKLLPQIPAIKYYEDLATLGPDVLRKRLPADTVLVDFLRYTDFEPQPGKKGEKRTIRYVAFIVSRQDVRRVELGEAGPIDAVVRDWRRAISAKFPVGNDGAHKEYHAKIASQAAALRRLVWEPVERQLLAATATIYLAPDAELTQLPWAALPGKGKDRVLLEDYALAVLPHGPFLLEQLTAPPPRPTKRPTAAEGLLLVGGIRYDDKPNAFVNANRGAEGVVDQKVVWDYLKGTEEERRLVAKVMQKSGLKLTANLSGVDAATERLRQELERSRYAHIGTHGFFADAKFRSVMQLDPKMFERAEFMSGNLGQLIGEGARSPLVLSGLVCAGANRPDTPERGILSGDAITGLLLDDLHLAVLSACDTGIGDVAGGEGVFGLQRAFHIAGCKNVVASLWKVDDAATAALMTRFYGHLFAEDAANRLPPIEALRRAQLELYRHPELIPTWAKGEQRSPGKPRPATTPAPAETPPTLLTSGGSAPIRVWAAFTLSGLGR